MIKIVKRKSRQRRYASVGFRSFKRARRQRSGIGGGFAPLLGAAAYGAVRAKIAQFVSPLTSKMPGGVYADNIAMLLTAWAAKKFIGGRVPFVSQLANAGMLIEAAQIGQEFTLGVNGNGTSGSSTTVGGWS